MELTVNNLDTSMSNGYAAFPLIKSIWNSSVKVPAFGDKFHNSGASSQVPEKQFVPISQVGWYAL